MVANTLPTYTLAQVAEHKSKTDCWVAINTQVFNVTNWLNKHPGGASLILNLAGRDCSHEFKTFHLNPNYKRLRPFLVGNLAKEDWKEETSLGKELQDLTRELREGNAFEIDYLLYVQQAMIICSLLTLSMAFLHYSQTLFCVCISAAFLGLFWQQLAFVGHDLGHHVVTHDRVMDEKLGLILGNFLQGISVAWWRHNHNTHHTLTNSINHDPDIQHLPVFAVSKKFFNNVFSTYYKRVMKCDKIASRFVSIQHYMFFPVMGLARFNLYVQSMLYNLAGAGSTLKTKSSELVALAGFYLWLFSLLTYVGYLSSPTYAVMFLFVSHATAGLVHIQICISHFSMETYMDVPQNAFDNDGYLISQLMTTMNVDCPAWMDFFHGGLQFQIEHHIFPHITRSKLRYAQKKVQELCRRHGLPHHSQPFFGAITSVLDKLYETSRELKLSHMIWDGMNMVG